jgi:Ca2+-binding EF-hand superfamily protein
MPTKTPDDDSSEELDEVREEFNHFDRDASGTIDARELARLMEALGAGLSEEELAAGVAALDLDKSGKISWDEFRVWWSTRYA